MTIPEKVKLEALAYTRAGLSPSEAARKVNVSPASVGKWAKDRILQAKALQLYLAAIRDARERRRPVGKKAEEILREQREAKRIAALPKAGRVGYARKVAETEAVKKMVIVHRPVTIVLSDEEEIAGTETDIVAALERLKERFKVTEKKR